MQPGVPSGKLTEVWASDNGESATNVRRFGPTIASFETVAPASTLPSLAETNDQVQELRPRGDNDDANRQLAESRAPVPRRDARLDVEPAHYVPAKDEHVTRDSTRSSSLEFVARGPR